MIQIHPTKSFLGFGNNDSPGENYFSKGMALSQHGIRPQWSLESLNTTQLFNFMTRADFTSGVSQVYGCYYNGIYLPNGTTAHSVSSVYGIIGDQKNRLLYLNGNNIGKYDGTTWNDSWKAMANDLSTNDFAPMEAYEDCILVGLNDKLGRVNGDDSINDKTTYAFHLPTGFKIRAIKANKNGILIGANSGMKGIIVLWDNSSYAAITPWIWTNSPIQTIVKYGTAWIVVTAREIILTDGYTSQTLSERVDIPIDGSPFFQTGPQGATLVDDRLILALGGSTNTTNRMKMGLHIFNLVTKKWEYAPYAAHETNATGNCIFTDSILNTIYVNYNTNSPFAIKTGILKSTAPTISYVITEPLGKGDNEKTAQAVKLELGISNEDQVASDNLSATVDVKVYNFKRPLWGFAQTNAASAQANQIRVDGSTYKVAQDGDEVTIAEGANAGEIRHILSITNKGTNTETWTLDSALPNLSENTIYVSVQPFKRASSAYTMSNLTELKDLLFPVKNSMQGKKFLVKVVFTGMSGARLELQTVNLIYDDKGLL